MKLKPTVFNSGTGPLSGFLSLPDGPDWRDRGVVICAPIGYENGVHYRHLRVLARRLSDAGRPTLRFDWRGCGDSGGDDSDPGLVGEWIHSVGAATRTLREQTGVGKVDVIGLRIGATLAAAAAAADPDIGDVVLWAPFTTGRSYLREMRAFHRLAEKTLGGSPRPDEAEGQEVSGFLLAPSTVDDLVAIDLRATDFAAAQRRVLIAGRDALPDPALVDHLRVQAGMTVETAVLSGFDEVAMSWSDASIPWAAFDVIQAWLAPGKIVPAVPEAERTIASRALDAGGGVTEHVVILRPEDPVVGVISMADAGEVSQPPETWVVFLSSRFIRRSGPNRLYTSFARRWAAEGLPSLRLDVRATGDGGGPEQETVHNMYSDDAIDDARLALAFLREEHGARRFVFVGLCSGAFVGLHTALAEPDVAGVALISVTVLVWVDSEVSETLARTLRAMAFRRVSWERLLRGQVPVMRVSKVALLGATTAIRRRARASAQRLAGRDPVNPITSDIRCILETLAERRCALHFISPKGDPGLSYLKLHLGEEMTGLVDQPTFTLVEIADTDHTFRPLWSHETLREEIESLLRSTGFLSETHANAPTSTAASDST